MDHGPYALGEWRTQHRHLRHKWLYSVLGSQFTWPPGDMAPQWLLFRTGTNPSNVHVSCK